MRLELLIHPVTGLRWGDATRLDGEVLAIGRDDLTRHLLEDPQIVAAELAFMAPGDSCRAVPVFDVVEPRAKLDGGADFPGALGPPRSVGAGATAVLRGAAVVVLDPGEQASPTMLEANGPGAALSVYGGTHHLVVMPRTAEGLSRLEQLGALRRTVLRAAVYLARAAGDAAPARREVYELPPLPDSGLPRVAYVYQVHSHQRPTHPGEPVLYGDNVRHLLPTILHPSEILDGAVLRTYGGTSMETYSIQNHPVIRELYRRHGQDLDFAGVVVTVAHNTLDERERAVTVAANLVAHTLRATGAILSKSGGGAPHVDMALVARRLESLGVRTTCLSWDLSSATDGDDGGALFNYPELDAIVNYGNSGFQVTVPAVERVLGGRPNDATAFRGPLDVGVMTVCGMMNQLGGGRLISVTY